MGSTFTKKPSDTKDYQFDWGPFLAAAGDTLSSISWQLVGTGSIVSTSLSGNIATAFVTGGADGEVMNLNCTMTSVGGIVDTDTDYIRVRLVSLIVEYGTGNANSESYADQEFADAYHSDRNNTAWATLTQAQKEAYLRQATDFMMELYRLRWKGRRVLINQALDWPRVGVILEDFGGSQGRNGFGSYGLFQVDYKSVPIEIKKACVELALRAMNGVLSIDLAQKVLRKKVGPLEVEYDPNSPQWVRYRKIDETVRPFLLGTADGTVVKTLRS
jgi:hypothetical protein